VRRRAGKRELLLNRLGPGDFFGEINLFDPGTATATVVAMSPTQLAVIPHRELLAWFEVNSAAGYRVVSAFMREMSRRFRMVNSRLANSAYWKPGPAVEG
jgi:CRP-like cAMP-binding protein